MMGLTKQLKIYQGLTPATFSLKDIPIDDLFQAVAVIHPRAYQLMKSLLQAYPQNHFKVPMQEAIGVDFI